MALQSIIPPPLRSLRSFRASDAHSISSSISYYLSFPSMSRPTTPFHTISAPIHRVTMSVSRASKGGSLDFERRPMLKWSDIYKRISLMESPDTGAAVALNECESKGKRLTKWELCRVIRELRKYKRFKHALEVYEWMNNKPERFSLFGSDAAIQLDLIAKVHGISSAEDFFSKLPAASKDKRTYGALLNAYVWSKVREKAEPLMNEMRSKGYAMHPLPYNVMMTLYMKLKEYEKVDSLISEMKQKNIDLDIYSYNIWLSARGSLESEVGMEEVFEEMKMDKSINPSWTTFSTMATIYIRLGQLEKADGCLKSLETRIVGRDRIPYHYLISLYGSAGKKEEVYRAWGIYKSVFPSIPNWGYHAMISSLVRVGDIEGAETIYEEWMSVKSSYDAKITNLLLGWYVKEGNLEKAESLFNRIGESGGNPNSSTWETLAEGHIKLGRMSEAMACLKEATSALGSKNWMPKPDTVSAMLKLCEQAGDDLTKESFIELLKQLGCFESETYRLILSGINLGVVIEDANQKSNSSHRSDSNDENDQTELLMSVTESSL